MRAHQDGASLHLTVTVWANCEPKLLFGPSWLKKDSLNAFASSSVSGSGFLTSAVQPLTGGPDKVTGRFGGKTEGNEEGRIVDVDLYLLAMRVERRRKRQGEVEREQALVVIERRAHSKERLRGKMAA